MNLRDARERFERFEQGIWSPSENWIVPRMTAGRICNEIQTAMTVEIARSGGALTDAIRAWQHIEQLLHGFIDPQGLPLFLLRRAFATETENSNAFDEAHGFVVAAPTEFEARRHIVLSNQFGDEGREVWVDPNRSTCRLLATNSTQHETCVVLEDFNAA